MRTVVIARCHGALRCYVVKLSMRHAIQYVEEYVREQFGENATVISATEVAYGPEFI